MAISIGDRLPETTFVKVTADGPEQIASADFFKGRRIALFSVPGAFTPTCSARHLPGFVDKAEELKAKGVDEIAATAVNDAFVLKAWGQQNDPEGRITMLADGNAAFVTALGLSMDASGYGMGTRGQRFSLVANDGVVEQLNVEKPGSFEVSGADTLLGQL